MTQSPIITNETISTVVLIVVVLTVLFAGGVIYFWTRRTTKRSLKQASIPKADWANQPLTPEVQAVIDAASHPQPSRSADDAGILPFAEAHEVTATMPAVRAAQDAEMLAERARLERAAEPTITVFISYHRASSALLATLIANFCASQGIRAFVDTLSINEAGQLSSLIEQNIQSCDVFVGLINARTLTESMWVKQEIGLAVKLRKPMIPVYHQGYRPSATGDALMDRLIVESAGLRIDDIDNEFVNEALIRLVTMIRNSINE